MSKAQRIITIIITALVLTAGAWYFFSPSEKLNAPEEVNQKEDLVAVVNGEGISRADLDLFKRSISIELGFDITLFDAETQAEFRAAAFDRLITRALLLQEVRQSGVIVPGSEVDAQIEATKSQYESEAAFKEAFIAQELTEEEFRSQVADGLAIQAYIDQKLGLSSLSVTDAEIEAAYAQAFAGREATPELEDVLRDQAKALAIARKRENLSSQFIQGLRAGASIEILQ